MVGEWMVLWTESCLRDYVHMRDISTFLKRFRQNVVTSKSLGWHMVSNDKNKLWVSVMQLASSRSKYKFSHNITGWDALYGLVVKVWGGNLDGCWFDSTPRHNGNIYISVIPLEDWRLIAHYFIYKRYQCHKRQRMRGLLRRTLERPVMNFLRRTWESTEVKCSRDTYGTTSDCILL